MSHPRRLVHGLVAQREAAGTGGASHVGAGDGDAGGAAFFVDRKAIGVSEEVHRFAAFHGVAADELGNARLELHR